MVIWPWSRRATDWSKRGMIYTPEGLRQVLAGQRGFNEPHETAIKMWDGDVLYRGLSWGDMATFYAKARLVGPYRPNIFDCENFAKCAASDVAHEWNQATKNLPPEKAYNLAHGVIYGVLPRDGLYAGSGRHALNWFLDDEGRFWLYGPQERSVKSRNELEGMKEIWEIEVE